MFLRVNALKKAKIYTVLYDESKGSINVPSEDDIVSCERLTGNLVRVYLVHWLQK